MPTSLLLQSQTYINYKSTNTFKRLVGISPAEHVMFVSSFYTGSISDSELVEQSGLLSPLKSADELVADQGFTIQDVMTPLGVHLNISPFLGKREQLAASEVVDTQQIASYRKSYPLGEGAQHLV